MEEKVTEIARVESLQSRLVEAVHMRALTVGVTFVLDCIQIIGVEPAVLPPVDQSGKLAGGPAFLVDIALDDQCFQRTKLVVGIDNREVRLQTDQLGVAAEHLCADGMECPQPRHAFQRAAGQSADSFAHLAGSLVGKGDAEDLARPGAPHGDDMRPAAQSVPLSFPFLLLQA